MAGVGEGGALKRILSLGAGVQSSTLALMAAAGELEMPDCAIFADTGWEPKAVYEWLRDYMIPRLPFPVHVVTKGNIRADSLASTTRSVMPYFNKQSGGPVLRKCTSEYKIIPIEKKIREILGLKHRQRWPKELVVEQWLGISLDEIQRMKVSTDAWRVFRHPLIEKRMSRWDCLLWLANHGHPQAPRSACIGCPFHSNDEWRRMRDEAPDEWRDAVEFDSAIRVSGGMRGETFLHRQCVPLNEVDLSTAADHGQLSFLDECAGVCGV